MELRFSSRSTHGLTNRSINKYTPLYILDITPENAEN